jgi:small subunit ribosomal protein S4
MSRYRGPKLRVIRRLGTLPGLTQKVSKKKGRPGQHGNSNEGNNKKVTEYGLRLEEKQKLKFNYGITENQLFNYVKEARRRKGITGLILLQLLEMRLDTICFNLGFATTISNARQLVTHGHIAINGNILNIPSFQCRINDLISIKQNSKNIIEGNLKTIKNGEIPSHLSFDSTKIEAKVLNYANRDNILLELDELLVIEYYSRR